jgi:hypothetical protein
MMTLEVASISDGRSYAVEWLAPASDLALRWHPFCLTWLPDERGLAYIAADKRWYTVAVPKQFKGVPTPVRKVSRDRQAPCPASP